MSDKEAGPTLWFAAGDSVESFRRDDDGTAFAQYLDLDMAAPVNPGLKFTGLDDALAVTFWSASADAEIFRIGADLTLTFGLGVTPQDAAQAIMNAWPGVVELAKEAGRKEERERAAKEE